MLLVLLAGSVLAGQAPAPSAQTPTFKVQVDYVEVDALVVDRAGGVVRDLKKEDFQVLEDGRPQTVTSFSMVDVPVDRYERPLYVRQPIEPDVRTNQRPFDGRLYVALIDDLHTSFRRTARVKGAARQFIERHLGANDLMAVVHIGAPGDASQDFTNSKRLLLAAVDRTLGRKLDSPTIARTSEYFRESAQERRLTGDRVGDPLEAERSANARRSLDAVRDVARWFADVHGRRKSILFFSEGLDFDMVDVFSNRNTSLLIDATRETIAAATRGGVSIYGIDPRGLAVLGDETIDVAAFPDNPSLGLGQASMAREMLLSQSSLRELSEETGGFAALNANDFSSAFTKIVNDNSTYYVLAYYPPSDKPGKAHTIEVRVNRPGVTVRARKAYMTPRSGASAKGSGTALGDARKLMTPEIRDVLDSPMPVSGLTMRVFASPFKGTPPNASVMLGVDLSGRDLRLDPNDTITVSYLAVDPSGKIRGGDTAALTMSLKADTKARAEEHGLRLLNRLELPPGRYQLRLAAHDSGGRKAGSVLYDLEVPDFSKLPLSMSGMALGSALDAVTPLARIDDQLRAFLPVVPSSRRTFSTNDELVLFVEVYDNQGDKPHKVEIAATITTDEGRQLFKMDEVRDSTEMQGKRGGYGYVARLPLRGLEAGSYVLTVSARSRLGEGPSAERQTVFSVGEAQ